MDKKLIAPIPTDEAMEYAANWRSFNEANTVDGNPLNNILANAFTFDLSDVTDILKETGVCKVRVYFGYVSSDPSPVPSPTPDNPLPMKVMLVGVDESGKDIIYPEGSERSGIYDFAVPCPSTCDYESPLSISPPTAQAKS
jgi:hypothetical protein